jgi:hypothetical protein
VYFLSNQRNKECKQTCYGAQLGKVWLRARHSSFWVARLGVFWVARQGMYVFEAARQGANHKSCFVPIFFFSFFVCRLVTFGSYGI